jgi:CheY-like chemotaxis protein
VRTLVVDDDRDLRDGLVECLRMEGAEVFGAATGNEGFDTFVRERPNVIVSDLWMPDGTGYQLIARIRRLPPAQGGLTPAIAISAAANEQSALLAGYQGFLAKPFDLSRLVNQIAGFAAHGP